ncbi:MAG: PEP-CTERM sorting domain-containing protein [Planctomycetota bacterium]|jgi:hypothetical protein
MKRVFAFASVCLLTAVMGLPSAHAVVLDLTTPGTSGTINGAVFQQFSDGAGGSGNIDAFVRVQANPIEQGYHTDYRGEGFPEYDEDTSPSFNHSLLLSEVPIVSDDGTDYREFLLDVDQSSQYISLDDLEIALHGSGNLFGYATIFAAPIYDMDAGEDSWIKLDYTINAGSGAGDMLAFIPDSLFMDEFGVYLNDYVYLYSMFGVNFAADNGFEEWAHGIGGPVIPEPATICLLGLGALALLRKRRT